MEKQEMKNNGGEKGNEPTGWENMDVPQAPAAIDVTEEIGYVNTLDDAKSVLEKASQEKGGIPVSMKFNGHIIRSDMSEDEMYLEVTGNTKQDHEKAKQEWIAQHEKSH